MGGAVFTCEKGKLEINRIDRLDRRLGAASR
jgi:hypothetical protein